MYKTPVFLGAFCLALFPVSGKVLAQSMDYTVLEELFGEPVTTSATGKPQRVSDVPVTMEIITSDDIRRSGAVDLAEVLRQVNGINVVQKSGITYDVGIRGYNHNDSQRLLVLVNGRQVYLDYYGYTNWAAIPVQLEEIRQIEVVKGPNAALFGFNAVSGVINIVTYNPLYDMESSMGVTAGTGDYYQTHYVQSLKLSDNLGVRLSGGKRVANSFNNPANGTVDSIDRNGDRIFDDPMQEAINLDSMLQLTDKSQVRMELSGSSTDQGTIVSTGMPYQQKYITKSARLSYSLDSDWGIVKASLYRNYLDLSFRGGVLGNAENVVTVAQLEDTIDLGSGHTVRAQAEYRDNSFTSPTFMAADVEVGYNIYALSGMWDWVISDKWSWTNALRMDHLNLKHTGSFNALSPYTDDDYKQHTTEISYNSGIVWKPCCENTFRLSTARGIEIPSLLEFAIDLMPVLAGNPRLEASVVTNYELAWDRSVESIDGVLRSAVFYNVTEDVKTIKSNNNIADNIGNSDAYGIELELSGKLRDRFDWGIGYIYQKTDDDLDNGKDGNTILSSKEYEDGNPVHQLNFKLGYKDGPWELDSLVYYVSETDQMENEVLINVDDYVGVNARVAYEFDSGVVLALKGQQLLESRVQTSVAPDIDRRVFVSVSKRF